MTRGMGRNGVNALAVQLAGGTSASPRKWLCWSSAEASTPTT